MRIRVAIIEDDSGIRDSLSGLLKLAPDLKCTGAFSNVETALKMLPLDWPDIVLMDINLPKMSGIEGAAKLKVMRPALQILMLTAYADNDKIFESLKAGASGYLLKHTPPAELIAAIHEVQKGGSPLSGAIARKVVRHFQQTPAPETESLSEREEEVLSLLAKGHQTREIAEMLGITFETVRTHLRRIYDKLHVNSRTEALLKYLGRS